MTYGISRPRTPRGKRPWLLAVPPLGYVLADSVPITDGVDALGREWPDAPAFGRAYDLRFYALGEHHHLTTVYHCGLSQNEHLRAVVANYVRGLGLPSNSRIKPHAI